MSYLHALAMNTTELAAIRQYNGYANSDTLKSHMAGSKIDELIHRFKGF